MKDLLITLLISALTAMTTLLGVRVFKPDWIVPSQEVQPAPVIAYVDLDRFAAEVSNHIMRSGSTESSLDLFSTAIKEKAAEWENKNYYVFARATILSVPPDSIDLTDELIEYVMRGRNNARTIR